MIHFIPLIHIHTIMINKAAIYPLYLIFRDAFKKSAKFRTFVLKGWSGSFQEPNFFMPLIWDILGKREGVKT